jgi:hypothetical protein
MRIIQASPDRFVARQPDPRELDFVVIRGGTIRRSDAIVTPMPADLTELQARLEAVLDPYRDRLESFELYGTPYLRRPGAKAHDWFAGVSEGKGVVRFFLLPMHHQPELLDGLSPELRKRKTGASLFSFKAIDDDQLAELTALVARAFDRYVVTSKG